MKLPVAHRDARAIDAARTTRRSEAMPAQLAARAPHKAFLVVIGGFRIGDCIPLDSGEHIIGRDRAASVYLPDESVSRRHCVLTVGDEGALLRDLDSTNGCVVNGERALVAAIDNGDEVELGDVALRFFDGSCREGNYHLAVYEQASRDALTGLLNRRQILRRAADCLALTRQTDERMAVMVIDTDRFKQVNDRYGHAVGDQLLCRIADLLRTTLRGDCYLGRLGGDEFLAVLPGVDADAARLIASRMNTGVRALPVDAMPALGRASVTIGVAIAEPADSADIDAQIDRADQALLLAKREGRDRLAMAPAG